MIHDYEPKRKLALRGSITLMQPYHEDKIIFFVRAMKAFYLYHPKTQRTQKIITNNPNPKTRVIRRYLIDDKQKYLILNQIINKEKYSKQVVRKLKQTQIIGVINQTTIALILKQVGYDKVVVKLKKLNEFGDTLYKKQLCISQKLQHFCFDTTFFLLSKDLGIYWVFLQNNRRIQFDLGQQTRLPCQNFTHNKNYYLFKLFRKKSCVNFIVRQHSQFKIIRKIFFKNLDALQIGKWLYLIENERWRPLRRINLTNCKVQVASENLSAIKMCRTNDSKYLVFSLKQGLYTLKSLGNE